MSLKKIKQVKVDKGFKIFDLIVYGCVVLLVIAMFVAVFATRDTGELKGIRIYSDNVLVFEYDFENKVYNDVLKNGKTEIISDFNGLTVKIKYGEKGYNTVRIENKTVRVIEADCATKDCMYMKPVKDKSGMIYCSPHRLRIIPYEFDGDDGFIIM